MLRLSIVSVLFGTALVMAAQVPIPLRDGQSVTLHGTLVLRPAGRLQFVALRTTKSYLPLSLGNKKTSQLAETHELGLSGYHSYQALYQHREQQVTVRGRVMTDDASPYFLNNVSLMANSVRLNDGTELDGHAQAPARIAIDVGQYTANVVLPADLARPWQYSAHGKPDADHRFLSCGSNGGGDVVNCACADGFRALQATAVTNGVTAQVFDDTREAQFGVGDEARRVQLSVTCTR